MEKNSKIIIGLLIIVAILCIGIMLVLPPKTVDGNYCASPTYDEKVRFTGTYLGTYNNIYNTDGKFGVIQVGDAYVEVSTDKLNGVEIGQNVTVDGKFKKVTTGFFIERDFNTVPINGKYVNTHLFVIEKTYPN